jgi:hypothetical protein
VRNVALGCVRKIEQEMVYKDINVDDVDMCGRIRDIRRTIVNFMKNTQYEDRAMLN